MMEHLYLIASLTLLAIFLMVVIAMTSYTQGYQNGIGWSFQYLNDCHPGQEVHHVSTTR
jgi:hypothetical protein